MFLQSWSQPRVHITCRRHLPCCNIYSGRPQQSLRKQQACKHTVAPYNKLTFCCGRIQILGQLQAIAAQNELRFEVNRSTALVFQVRCSAHPAVT